MATDLRSGERYRVILDNTFTASLPDGAQLRVDHRDSSALVATETIDADANGADFEPLATGLYWLAWRPDEDSDWCPAGVIECVTLVDEDEERLIAELAEVNKQIEEGADEPDSVPGDGPERDGGYSHDPEEPPRTSRDPRAADWPNIAGPDAVASRCG